MTTFVDFRSVRQSVPIGRVLDHYEIRLRRVGGEILRGSCPLPTHTSEKSKYSFTVNVVLNVWACHSVSCMSVRGGKAGGDVLDLVALMEDCSVREAASKLREWFPIIPARIGANLPVVHPDEDTCTKGDKEQGTDLLANKPLPSVLSPIDQTHPYFRKRGLTLETIETFGVGYFQGAGVMAGRIVIPIHNERGELVAYAGRSIDGREPRYRLPAGFRRSLELFNLNRVTAQEVIVVEGFFDCMKVWQSLNPFVVALMGCAMSHRQEELLVRRFKRVTLLLDGDEPGRRAAERIASRLVRHLFVRIIELPFGKQPDQFSSEDLRVLLL
ncbi:MAG: toprim domain-containing protein [Bryobacteraceae bacterium]|nr:toprim domain-containing protein [Bryobacteraceae bacterium]